MYVKGSAVIKRFKSEYGDGVYYRYYISVRNARKEYYNFRVYFNHDIVPPVFDEKNDTAFIDIVESSFSVRTHVRESTIDSSPVIYIRKFNQEVASE